MKDKLEPNMYVRLNCNYEIGIGKTIGEIDEDNFIKTKFKDGFECSLPIYMIKKASHNIIDLIEVGDYVNGYKVLRIEKDYLFDYREEINILIVQNDEVYEVAKKIYSDGIKSIVTKEMFENISYEVE